MRSKIEPVKKFARTVRGHRELLLNGFRAEKQFSSGVRFIAPDKGCLLSGAFRTISSHDGTSIYGSLQTLVVKVVYSEDRGELTCTGVLGGETVFSV